MSTRTSKTALGAARVSLLIGVSATALLCTSAANATPCALTAPPNNAVSTALDSLACGPNATTDGPTVNGATAVGGGGPGNGPAALTDNSTALGAQSFASGPAGTTAATALGFNSFANNGNATAVGSNSWATGANSIGIGFQPALTGGAWSTNSIAVGTNASANFTTGTGGIAVGTSTNANQASAVAIGSDSSTAAVPVGASATGISAIALGGRNQDGLLGGTAAQAANNGDIAIGGGVNTIDGARILGNSQFGVAVGTGSTVFTNSSQGTALGFGATVGTPLVGAERGKIRGNLQRPLERPKLGLR